MGFVVQSILKEFILGGTILFLIWGSNLQHIVIILVWDFGPMSKGRQGKGKGREGKGKGKGCCKRGPYFLHLIWGPVWQKIFFTSESAA